MFETYTRPSELLTLVELQVAKGPPAVIGSARALAHVLRAAMMRRSLRTGEVDLPMVLKLP